MLVLATVVCSAAALPLSGLRVGIVGGGASGLLLAHRLLDSGAAVTLYESRQDPRLGLGLEGRAYALGLGLRGRTAIRSVDEGLWQSVAAAGFGSDRFTLHLPFASLDLRKPSPGMEPSVLIYQTDLCSALLGQLERRHGGSGRLDIRFECAVESVDVASACVRWQTGEATFDLVAGCDGVQSAVRRAIASQCPAFVCEQATLDGFLKVVRLDAMPAALATDAVHAVPGSGGLSAFLEPTKRGACALISWRGSADRELDPSALDDPVQAAAFLAASLPLIAPSLNISAVGEQFVSQRASVASTVRCNTFHYGRAVLLGDAAHSTGGASGQGCNAALQDAVALADALEAAVAAGEAAADGEADEVCGRLGVDEALATYSRSRVPEGHALLDLSVGPPRSAGPLARVRFGLSAVSDTLLSKVGLAEPPLQTLLTTSLTPFAQIRKAREGTFGTFPCQLDFEREIARASGEPREADTEE